MRKIAPDGTVTTLNHPGGDGPLAIDRNGICYYSRFDWVNYSNFYGPPDLNGNYHIVGKLISYIGFVYRTPPDGKENQLGQMTYSIYPAGYENLAGPSSWIGGMAINSTGLSIAPGYGNIAAAESGAQVISSLYDIAIDATANVLETVDNSLRRTAPNGARTTLAGITEADARGSIDGDGAAARFTEPDLLALDAEGNLYVNDTGAHRVRKVSPAGKVTTLAEVEGRGIAVDREGNVYLADENRAIIKKISPAGAVTILAGLQAIPGHQDGTGTAATFYLPRGLTIGSDGNLYVVDGGNCTIRKVTPAGIVTTLAGAPLEWGTVDGTGSAARFASIGDIAADAHGNLFVTEVQSSPTPLARIRKVTLAGAVTTFAGGDPGFADGRGTAAKFNGPEGIASDANGNLFVSDNYAVRKITPDGVVTTIGGLPGSLGQSDGVGSDARFYYPNGLAVNAAGMLYVASGTTIRQGQLAGAPVITSQPQSQTVAAGASVQFSVTASAVPAPTYQWYVNGSAFAGATTNTLSFTTARSSDAGDYTVVITNAVGQMTSSKATLTISSTQPTNPSNPPGAGASGGGGAPSVWFLAALAALGIGRSVLVRRQLRTAASLFYAVR
jgi:sugar lactone lactonase YvrE